MHIKADTLDDALARLFKPLLASELKVPTSRGNTRELIAVMIELALPRARLSRSEMRGKPFSCLGELLWYLAGDNTLEFITNYIPHYKKESDDGRTVYGAYGPRLFAHQGHDQIDNVINLLRDKLHSRRAVIQLFDAADISEPHKEIPCTTTLQFLVRDGAVDLIASMRSNDAYKGLPHDVFCFSMLQEIVARSLGFELGTYRHFAGSMHIYEEDAPKAELYLSEGVQPKIEMPIMPKGDPWPAIELLKEVEAAIRGGKEIDVMSLNLDPYWSDLVRLLQVFAARGDDNKIDAIKKELDFKRYCTYVQSRKGMAPRAAGVDNRG